MALKKHGVVGGIYSFRRVKALKTTKPKVNKYIPPQEDFSSDEDIIVVSPIEEPEPKQYTSDLNTKKLYLSATFGNLEATITKAEENKEEEKPKKKRTYTRKKKVKEVIEEPKDENPTEVSEQDQSTHLVYPQE